MFVLTSLPKNNFLGISLIRLFSWLSEGLDTTQMVLVVWKYCPSDQVNDTQELFILHQG